MHTRLRKIQILSPTAAGTRPMGCDPQPHSSLPFGAPHFPYSCCPTPPTHTPPGLGTYMFSNLNVSMVLGPHWLQWLTLQPTSLQPWPASSGWHPGPTSGWHRDPRAPSSSWYDRLKCPDLVVIAGTKVHSSTSKSLQELVGSLFSRLVML